MSERELVERARKGDVYAFGELVKRRQTSVYAYAYAILRREADALDVSQEAFLRAFRDLRRLKDPGKFFPWLLRITHSRAMDAANDDLRRRFREGEAGPNETLADDAPMPLDEVLRRERKEVLWSAFAELAPEPRALLRLAYFEGLSYDEIGDILGVPVGTVKSRVSRAKAKLRALLREKGGDEL